ncbi:HIT family protein [Candidatus Woesebacteria bacterium]|nr:HIT family protein [Candidatus Woesebacteria bacterium]
MESKPRDFIFETKYWEIYLNPDQYYLGRCVVATKRDVGEMSLLTDEEWLDFADLVRKIESGFKKAFGATMFNWTCLMNNAYQKENPHPRVHWHLRPRYKNTAEFAGIKFEDKEFGHHYARSTESPVSEEIFNKIIKAIRNAVLNYLETR